ncbi:MAG: hypothetical protein M0Q95_10900 [Porticoccaceae bacterium]|nr:hypothetical protein [Porticoccaceae bacterium]
MIEVHNDAVSDLRYIHQLNKDDSVKLAAFIQQLKADKYLISKLLEHGFGSDWDEPINVKKWNSTSKIERILLWRLRSIELERKGLRYRFIYLYYHPEKKYIIMAIVHRDEFDYDDPNHEIRKRIISSINRDLGDY